MGHDQQNLRRAHLDRHSRSWFGSRTGSVDIPDTIVSWVVSDPELGHHLISGRMLTVARTSIFWFGGGAVGVVGLLCLALKESRPSTVLRQEVKAVSERTGFSRLSVEEGDSSPTFNAFIRTSLLQPQRLFFTEPIVTLTAIMASTVYGVVYLFSECLDIVYVEEFGLSNRQASLVLLPIGVGVILSFLPRIYDVRVARSCVRDGTPWEPEHKLFGFYIAAPVLAFGLWWFSGTVPPLTHFQPWPSIMSLIFVGYSVTEFDNVLAGYLTDTYASYAASANASVSTLVHYDPLVKHC